MKNLITLVLLFSVNTALMGQFIDVLPANLCGATEPDHILDGTLDHNRLGHLESGTYGDAWSQWSAIGKADLNFPPSQCNYYGYFSNWSSDRAFFGLVNNGFNRSDALIAFGDNHDGAPDYNRLIFRFDSWIPNFDREIATMRHNGNFGLNTANPTATFHLDAVLKPGDTNPSNVRFENLQTGDGNLLLIDPDGYVYDSQIPFGQTDPCNDICYWRVEGNNILPFPDGTAKNKFGTLTNDNVRIVTNNQYRGIITNTGEWGMGTMTPTAKLHVQNSQWGLGHIDASGDHPALRLYENSLGNDSHTIRLALATSNSDFTNGSIAGDGILQNIGRRRSLIFGSAWNNNLNNGVEHMRIDHTGQVGINTKESAFDPTAFLHVNCINGNENGDSDVRFENLEEGEGTVLVIRDDGYVFNSHVSLNQFNETALEEQKRINEDLQKQILMLSKKLTEVTELMLELKNTGIKNKETATFELYPNPSKGNFKVNHYIPVDAKSASLRLVDQNGKEVYNKAIMGKELCTSEIVIPSHLSSGNYYCTLYIDKSIIETKLVTYLK